METAVSDDFVGAKKPTCPNQTTGNYHPVNWVGDRAIGSGSWVCALEHSVVEKAPVMGKCPACHTKQPVADVCAVCGAQGVTPGIVDQIPLA
jgi:hypothetical protein